MVQLTYCPANETLTGFWINHGFSHCFLETTVSTVLLSFLLVFGIIQLAFYKKYATVVQLYRLPFSQLFGIQVILNASMTLIAILRIIVQVFVILHGTIYGYMVLSLIQGLIVWPLVVILILKERHYMLPTVPRKGHGLVLLCFWTLAFASQNLMFLNIYSPDWFFHLRSTNDKIRFGFFVVEYMFTGAIFLIGLKAPGVPSIRHSDSFTRLNPPSENSNIRISSGSPFRNICKKLKMLAPFIWPAKSVLLQIFVLISVFSLILGRFTNVYVPIYSKKIVDSLTFTNSSSSTSYAGNVFHVGLGTNQLTFRWDLLLIFVGLKVVQGGGAGGSGLLGSIRSLLWIKVEQYTTREVEVRFFAHLHNLSLRWHLQRKTGEVLRAMDRGTDSINNILNYLIFSILPTIADIIIAIVYLTAFFNGWFGLIVFITMFVYLIATFTITEWRTKYRRLMNKADNEQKQKAIDSLLNFETVKYYANEKFETARYADAIKRYQKEEWKVTASICVLNMVQLLLINVGLLVGSLLCMHMIVNGDNGFTVGDYILFTTYLLQLYAPLNYFGTYYRLLQKSFIDMENMLDLFKEEQEVVDIPGARELKVKNGAIEFRDVIFNYVPERTVLKGISFVVPPGTSAALVGPSGGGKTSIIRLLFRFYDPTSGEILIDGQSIQNVTQASLRQSIGVVPQDTVLFNDSISNNIKYGRIGSDDNDMVNAASVACIHEKIATFPERYDTIVGERGLKLSGGEKQRVAIARTVLKNPTIILLDEATSALDTHTERQIQSSLEALCQNRTSIIVAHRLSTIVNADQILVLNEGVIAESGSHETLMKKNGLYAAMWNEQLKGESNNNAGSSSTSGEVEKESDGSATQRKSPTSNNAGTEDVNTLNSSADEKSSTKT